MQSLTKQPPFHFGRPSPVQPRPVQSRAKHVMQPKQEERHDPVCTNMDGRRPEFAFEEGVIDLEPGSRVDMLSKLGFVDEKTFDRTEDEPVAATRVVTGTDVDYGSLTNHFANHLSSLPGFAVHYLSRVAGLARKKDGRWRIEVEDADSGDRRIVDPAKMVKPYATAAAV